VPVRIRLRRVGTKNVPIYRIVVADGRSPRDGRFIENIGTYDPRKANDNFQVDVERAKFWIGKGAQASDTVRSILKKAGRAAKVAA
jgi:small subunit ribosomal protein S16